MEGAVGRDAGEERQTGKVVGTTDGSPPLEPLLPVEDYVHVDEIVDALRGRGIKFLRPLQAKVVKDGLFFNSSFLVATPSGSGKTLVGELAVMHSILVLGMRAVFIVPYKALAHEKFRQFRDSYGSLGIRVKLAMGDYNLPRRELEECDLLITTFEKLDSLLRSESSPWKGGLNTVVVDEVHVLGDADRGARLEALLVRLVKKYPALQLVCLSATIANPTVFLEWLGSLLGSVSLVTDYERPVPLHYEVRVAREKEVETRALVSETLATGGQVLVFLNSRKGCSSVARRLAGMVGASMDDRDAKACRKAASELDCITGGFDGLPELLRSGVGIHHAGLNLQERRVVESLYFERHLKVICCTSTLAAGINLPARRVVSYNFEQARRFTSEVGLGSDYELHPTRGFSFKPVPRNRMHQVLGRAGRPGLDDVGYGTILTTSHEEKTWVEDYYFDKDAGGKLVPRYDPLRSALVNKVVLAEQVLIHVLELGAAREADLTAFLSSTFYWFCQHGSTNARTGTTTTRGGFVCYGDDGEARGAGEAGVDANCGDGGDGGNVGNELGPCEELEVVPPPLEKLLDLVVAPGVRRDWGALETKVTEFRVTSFTSREVSCKLVSDGMGYVCRFNEDSGPWCSCRGRFFKDSTGVHPLCAHLAASLLKLRGLSGRAPGKALRVARKSIEREGVVEWLLEEGFLKESGGRFWCTKFGVATSRGYLLPHDAVRVRGVLREGTFETVDDVLRAVTDEYATRTGRRKSVYPLLWKWIHEVPLSDIVKFSSYNLGDLNSIKADVRRVAGNFALVAKFYRLDHVAELCEVLSIRLDHGIREDLFDVVLRLRGVGRVRGRKLVDAGFRYVTELAGVTPRRLVELTGLTPYECEVVLEQVEEATMGNDGDDGDDGDDRNGKEKA
ncbi:MAG: DEAD/DEAH box helicase [Promethearchaeota archaeon]